MFQNNQYGRFLSGFLVFTITLFEAAAILESRFDFAVDSSILIAITLGVLGLRVASWVYLWLTHRTQPKPEQKEAKSATNLSTLLNVVLGLMVVGLVGFYVFGKEDSKVILEEALPQMEAALEREDVFEVYSTARELFESTENPLFESYLDKVTSRGNIYTNRPGVDVSFRFYNDTTNRWFDLGTSPVEQVRLPYTSLQLKFQEGDQEHTTWAHPYYIFEGSNKFILPPVGTPEASGDVIRKIGAKSRLSFPGLDHFDHVEYGPFDIAKREVTNAEFLDFVQQGGYNTDEGWDLSLIHISEPTRRS